MIAIKNAGLKNYPLKLQCDTDVLNVLDQPNSVNEPICNEVIKYVNDLKIKLKRYRLTKNQTSLIHHVRIHSLWPIRQRLFNASCSQQTQSPCKFWLLCVLWASLVSVEIKHTVMYSLCWDKTYRYVKVVLRSNTPLFKVLMVNDPPYLKRLLWVSLTLLS